jgi:hypothetical protein
MLKAKARVYEEVNRRIIEDWLLDNAPNGIWFRGKRYELVQTNITRKVSAIKLAKELMQHGEKIRLIRYGVGCNIMKQWAVYKHA